MKTVSSHNVARMDQRRIVRVQIIQPLIPAYRVPLFRRLTDHPDLHVRVCASRTIPERDNISSVETENEYADLEHSCIGFLGNRFLWQRNLQIYPDMGKGDVLVLCGNLRFLSNIPLLFEAKKRKVGIVWWGHGFSKRRNPFKDSVTRLIMRIVDVRLLYTGKEVEEYKHMGFPESKLFATNNTIDQQPINEATKVWTEERLKEFKEREKIGGKDILLFCGSRADSVSLDDVFAALAQLRKSNDKYLFVIIGSDDICGILGEKAKRLGVDDCVRWLGPMYDQHDLAPWFLSARCFVFPGAIGLSLLHAFYYGLPVIVPDCTHNPEIAALSDGENGLFYKDSDISDLTKKIAAITDHPEYYKKLSAKALQTVDKDYNMNNMVNRYVAVIRAASQKS